MDLLKVADYMNRHPVTFDAEMPVEIGLPLLVIGEEIVPGITLPLTGVLEYPFRLPLVGGTNF